MQGDFTDVTGQLVFQDKGSKTPTRAVLEGVIVADVSMIKGDSKQMRFKIAWDGAIMPKGWESHQSFDRPIPKPRRW